VGLPLFEAMLPGGGRARAAIASSPRMLFYYVPNGMWMDDWTPRTEGSDYELSPTLASLAGVKDDLLVLTGLANHPPHPPGVLGAHAQGTAGFLTCREPHKTDGLNIRAGVSVDQVAARALAAGRRLPSLQLGLEAGDSAGSCDSGYSCAYSRNISWANASTPLPKITNVRLAFDRLFAGFDPTATAEAAARRKARRLSVLDHVTAEAGALSSRLGAADRAKLDQYLTGLRELEVRVVTADEAPVCDPGEPPGAHFRIFPSHLRLMTDLMVLALTCDATGIVTFMQANAASGRSYEFLDASGAHHGLSHHQGAPESIEKLKRVDAWNVGEFAYLLDRMKAVEEPDGGTLLDDSMVFFSSEMSDGDTHSHVNLPVLLAGRAGGALRPGRHIRYPETPIADLFIAMLQGVDVPVTEFGEDGTAPLAGLT